MLNDLYNNLQKLNRHGSESGHSAHLCIDVEDAVSTCSYSTGRSCHGGLPQSVSCVLFMLGIAFSPFSLGPADVQWKGGSPERLSC